MINPHKLFFWYFSKKTLPYWCILALDCFFVFISLLGAYFISTGAYVTYKQFWPLCGTLCIYTFFYLIGFRLFRTYSGILRYSSFTDLQRVGFAVVIGTAISLIFKYAISPFTFLVALRTREILIGAVVATMLMWALRVLVKHLYDVLYHASDAEKVYVFGVREGGISIAKSLRNQEQKKFILAGFVSDQPESEDFVLMGVHVYPYAPGLADRMVRHNVKALFVSPLRSQALRESQEMVDELLKAGIRIYMMPGEQEWDGQSDITHQQMHEVAIEDLLPREQIQVDLNAIGKQLWGKRILITGAAGSIGSEMVRQISKFNPSCLILVDQAETPLHDIRLMMARDFPGLNALTIVCDITCQKKMETIFKDHKPEYVFHAAAYKHVPMMEDNPGESIHNNVEGTRIIADLAVKYGVKKFVMISTDKAVNPTNVMGCSKRICEIYVQSLDKAEKEKKIQGNTQFVTTRFGNVLGSNGSVIPLFRDQIKKGGPLTVTHPDIIRYFMLIPEACKLVLEAGTMGNGGEIFVFDMGKPVKIVELARRMIKLSGTNCEIKFTGLRDGEKLYEEVLNDQEITLPTFHPKIKIAKVREYDYEAVNIIIDAMVEACYKDSHMDVVRRMKEIVPEYISQNSVYQELDK